MNWIGKVIRSVFGLMDSIILTIITPIEGEPGSIMRYSYYRLKLKKCSGYFISKSGFRMAGCSKICIGKNCAFNHGVLISASDELVLGDNVIIGPYVVIRNANHRYEDIKTPIRYQGHKKGKVKIGDDVWIGAHVVILKDVEIGAHTIIAAQSLVNKNIGELEVWGGIPAKFIKKRE